MRILVMGSGGVGGYYGALLHNAGHEVTFVARGKHLDEIRKNGLKINSVNSGNFTIRPPAVDRPDGSSKADLILFCVKGYDNPTAIPIIAPVVGADTTILTIQNGIGSGDQLSDKFDRVNVLVGVTYISAAVSRPGTIDEFGGQTKIITGEEDGIKTERVLSIQQAVMESNIDFEVSDNIAVEIWTKLLVICALSGMMCITMSSLMEIMETEETFELTKQVVSEAEEVARTKGVDLPEDIVDRVIRLLDDGKHHLNSSMRVDLENGKPLEVHALNGAIARMGNELGVKTPVNTFITSCLTPAHNRAMAQRI